MKLLIITQKVDKNDDILGFFHSWIGHIASQVDELNVVALSVGEYSFGDNVSIFSLGKERAASKFLQAIRFYWYLFRILPKVDGIFIHMAPEYVRAIYPLNIFFRKPIIMWYAHIRVSPTARWALDRVDRVFTPSKESFSFSSDKVVSTGHGIDTEVFKPLSVKKDSAKKKILAMSRISRVKKIETLIKAVDILVNQKNIKNIKVDIVGGPAREEDTLYLSELKQMVTDYNLENYIEWLKPVPNKDTPPLYNSCDVFVRLQGGGGFGKTELEAMACGTPVVLCTNVYNNVFGKFSKDLYFPEDDAEKCADNIAKVLGWSEADRESYADLSRSIVVMDHNIENLAKRIVTEFDTVLNIRGG